MRTPDALALAAAVAAVAVGYGLLIAAIQEVRRRRWGMIFRLREMDGPTFERHVAETYRRLGYRVELTKASGDQGADVIAQRSGERIAIQCKRYTGTVGNAAVQQAFAAHTHYGCSRAAVVCSSRFTSSARSLAQTTGVELVDGEQYAKLVQSIEGQDRWRPRLRLLPRGRALAFEALLLLAASGIAMAHAVRW